MAFLITSEKEYKEYLLKVTELSKVERDTDLNSELPEILAAIEEYEEQNYPLLKHDSDYKYYYKLIRLSEPKELFHKRLLRFSFYHCLSKEYPVSYQKICNIITKNNLVELFDSFCPSLIVNFDVSSFKIDSHLQSIINKLDDGLSKDLY